ncbi:MAG: tRNA (N6-isopentenyl adenosine(37)-C2)-methylthiotransferase MiaB [Hornefia sp.]|nr:tRNA (N6-isopentenyl adenosine(37)-C2)-methylthiotransferase MiaB [Hornefia sp.]
MDKTFHITTFGCQMNEHDSEILAGALEDMGYVQAASRDEAQVVILNTCSVRENADKRFFGTLGQLKRKKKEDKDNIICICGCMMQQQHIIDTVKEKYPWVDVIFGTHNIHRFPELLKSVVQQKKKAVEIWEDGRDIVEDMPMKRLHRTKALVNIMYGCNNFCTYCIVPYTRGRERSRKPEDIVREVENLVSDGVLEIMLLGQNVNSYRGETSDGENCSFAHLIEMIAKIDGLKRIRFMTSHPKDLSDELIDVFKSCDKLCKSIHLPVQSGSSAVMKRMNRHYNRDDYMRIVNRIKSAVPEITISTDIIVGFPGETDEQFEETLSLVKEVGYDSAFTFLYSVRTGTPAAKFTDQIPEDIKHERFNRLVKLVDSISAEKNRAYEGRIEEVLVEGKSKRNENTLSGRTDGFKLVNFPGDESYIGRLVKVKITEGKTFSLEGKIV